MQPVVCVVTGASRGAGKGIALALAEQLKATVYVTGRSQQEGDAALPGTIHQTAKEIDELGGKGIAVACDHSDDQQVKALFEQVEQEQGYLNILVNNACVVPDGLTDAGGFWEKPLELQSILNVGMRSAYVASYYAAPLLIRAGQGLLVNTSSFGGTCYMHGPAYGAGKAAVDKMAHDMAVDFKDYNVAAISLWMGLLKTERTLLAFDQEPDKYGALMEMMESPQFSGRVIAALYQAEDRMEKSGQVHIGAELAQQYGVVDVDGKTPASHRPMLGEPTTFSAAVIE